MLAGDLTLIGFDLPFTTGLMGDGRYFSLLVDLCTTSSRPFGKSHGEICRLDVPILWMIEGANKSIRVAQRPEFGNFRGGDDFKRNTNRIGCTTIFLVLIHAVATGGQS